MDKLDWELPEVCAIPIDSVTADQYGNKKNDGPDSSGLPSSSSPSG
ncbi:lasso peptide [Legionella pneumophila serogroup 1]